MGIKNEEELLRRKGNESKDIKIEISWKYGPGLMII